MTIFLDVSNASINPTSLLWCSLFMISISRTMSSRDEPLPAVLSRMCLAANVVFEERSVTLFTTPNFPLFDEKLDFRCHRTKKKSRAAGYVTFYLITSVSGNDFLVVVESSRYSGRQTIPLQGIQHVVFFSKRCAS